MKHQHIFLLIVAVTCSLFSGCGSATPAQVVRHDETRKEKEPVSFMHDHTTGLEIARQERKPVLAFFSVPNNVGSQLMRETTFRDEEVKHLAERFVCVHIDGSQESRLCESLEISSFPTILLADASGSEVRRLIGGQTPNQLAVQMLVVLQTIAERSKTIVGR